MTQTPDPLSMKIIVLGLQGSGKTYYAKRMCEEHDKKTLVYSPHWHDFKDEGENFIFYDGFGNDPEKFFAQAIALGKKGQINGILFDEFDQLFSNKWAMGPNAIDFMSNHRHYGLFLIGISRAPTDIPAYVFRTAFYTVCYAIQGESVRTNLNGIYKGWGDMVMDLPYNFESPNPYVIKRIGAPPERKIPL